jgi:hypothetical protein
MLVMASMRLRLTAYSLAGLKAPEYHKHHGMAYARFVLTQATADLATFYERVAVLVGRPVAGQVLLPVKVPSFTGLNGTTSGASSPAGENSGVAVMTAPAGDADGLEEAGDLVRVVTAPITRICSGCTSICSTSARTYARSPNRPRTSPTAPPALVALVPRRD